MGQTAYRSFLIKYGEIGLKGKNRRKFEDALLDHIRRNMTKLGYDFSLRRIQGRMFVDLNEDFDTDEVIESLTRVFGIVGICPMVEIADVSYENIAKETEAYMVREYGGQTFTFKVNTRRADKSYPMTSMEMNAELGGVILDAIPGASVDVHTPEVEVYLEIRDNAAYLYTHIIPGIGGMPVGTNGKAMLLLSGGIDSPVAGYMIAKRGVTIEAVYFHAPPYTSERARQKVVDLAAQVAKYAGPIRLHIVNFTDIQMAIYEKCPHDELTIIMRRYMMRIAEHFAEKSSCLGMITGESIGQVASQTMKSLAVTNEVCTMPVYRPLIGMDKVEIIERAQKIGTFETSILPYEDCCTIFVAKHPVTKPNAGIIRRSEENLKDCIDGLMEQALKTTEIITVEG